MSWNTQVPLSLNENFFIVILPLSIRFPLSDFLFMLVIVIIITKTLKHSNNYIITIMDTKQTMTREISFHIKVALACICECMSEKRKLCTCVYVHKTLVQTNENFLFVFWFPLKVQKI